MNPNSYLRVMWRSEFEDIVFVAMSFDKRFDERFEEIIKPAIESEEIAGRALRAHRVDLSKSGESILTEITDGIAHCFLFLADVSTIDELRFSGKPARNANVLYEVGIALACRSSEEVLLIRDDNDQLIFDTSSIPHETIDFTDKEAAIKKIRALLIDRATERNVIEDARVLTALTQLAPDDLEVLRSLAALDPNQSADLRDEIRPDLKKVPVPTARALENLLRAKLATAMNITEDESLTYKLTDIGRAVHERFKAVAAKISTERAEAVKTEDNGGE